MGAHAVWGERHGAVLSGQVMRSLHFLTPCFAALTALLAGACSTGSPNAGDDAGSGGSGASMQGGSGGSAGTTLGGSAGKSGTGGANSTGGASAAGGASGTASTQGGSSGNTAAGGTGGTAAGTGGTVAGTTSSGGTGTGGMSTGGDGGAGMPTAGGGGTSGDAGMAGTSGAGGAPTGPCDIGGKILCDDFESTASGMLPSAAPWAARNCFDTTNTLKVDGGAHHSGSQALVGMNIPYADCQLSADLGASLTEYWVRAWVYFGEMAPVSSTHEVTVFELVPKANTDDPSIRIGYRGDTCMPIGVELNITGGGQEETGCTGQIPVANTWYCYVLHVKQMASSVTTDLSIDSADQSYTNHGQAQMEITSQVAGVRYLRLGPRSYSGNWTTPIYVDDVAVATQQLGCQ